MRTLGSMDVFLSSRNEEKFGDRLEARGGLDNKSLVSQTIEKKCLKVGGGKIHPFGEKKKGCNSRVVINGFRHDSRKLRNSARDLWKSGDLVRQLWETYFVKVRLKGEGRCEVARDEQ